MTTTDLVDAAEHAENDVSEMDMAKRLPKRKIALLLGYVGTNYHGMQMYAGIIMKNPFYT